MNKSSDNFDVLYAEALAAGRAAGEAWELSDGSKSGTDHMIRNNGPIGFAWVKIRLTNSEFGRWLKQTGEVQCLAYNRGYDIWISGYNRCVKRKKAHAEAMAAVLRDGGINADVESNCEDEKEVTLGMTPGSISSAVLRSDGYLVVERYDSDGDSDRWFGNDVSSAVIVSPRDKGKVLSLLKDKRVAKSYPSDENELLLVLLRDNFRSHYEVKEWLETNRIPYTRKFDARA